MHKLTFLSDTCLVKKRTASRTNGPTDREELLAGTTLGDLDSASSDQRQRLLMNTERLADSSKRLQDSHRVALQTGEQNLLIYLISMLLRPE
jgi:hypothetical protein